MNNVGCNNIQKEYIQSPREYFSLDSMDRFLYLEGLRRMKKGLQNESPRSTFFNRSLASKCSDYLQIEEVKEDNAIQSSKDTTEKAVIYQNDERNMEPESTVTKEEDYMETLVEEMKALVCSLPPIWPLHVVEEPKNLERLKRIITRHIRSQRHEMFMDSRQRDTRNFLPELVQISNNSFMNLFGKHCVRLDLRLEDCLGCWHTSK